MLHARGTPNVKLDVIRSIRYYRSSGIIRLIRTMRVQLPKLRTRVRFSSPAPKVLVKNSMIEVDPELTHLKLDISRWHHRPPRFSTPAIRDRLWNDYLTRPMRGKVLP